MPSCFDKLSMRDCFIVPLAQTLTLSLSKGELAEVFPDHRRTAQTPLTRC